MILFVYLELITLEILMDSLKLLNTTYSLFQWHLTVKILLRQENYLRRYSL